jgi:AraC family transcriptional regulator of arabinose operon
MDHRIQVVCFELESDPGNRLRITDLSQTVSLSSSRLRHLFKSETGQTLTQYLKEARMCKAQLLLDTTFLSVKEIMHRVGVNSDSHFARDFRETWGQSPTQYRARNRRSGLDGK